MTMFDMIIPRKALHWGKPKGVGIDMAPALV